MPSPAERGSLTKPGDLGRSCGQRNQNKNGPASEAIYENEREVGGTCAAVALEASGPATGHASSIRRRRRGRVSVHSEGIA